MVRALAVFGCLLACVGPFDVLTQVAAIGVPRHQAGFVGLPVGGPLQYTLRCNRQNLNQQQVAAARRPFVGGNWKCNGTVTGAEEILKMLNEAPNEVDDIEVVVAPPSLHAGFLLRGLKKPFAVALQDGSQVKGYGAYTGEVSPQMAKDFGIKAVIVGHSERREGFGNQSGESNEEVAAKAKNAVDNGLQVIACIGESLETRQSGKTMEFLGKQLQAYASALSGADWNSVVLAYEPIWAIGTGETATPEIAQETHKGIREWLKQHVGQQTAEALRIIYGGSVKGSNAQSLFTGEDVDGFLVGGASLTEDFHAVLKATRTSRE
ncbi:triosephosphate isomerase-like [Cyclospora cayetanensis]|uniref:Triosephosphate isomerase n=1 Tax=Cyclospora cayetanensis TaxID=88456 RepID=A0A6P6RZC5_9EIME|nr:triosephosphate isomerase-like [Cyclospora cayetanensis]